MAQQTINTGTSPNDGTGDPLQTAFIKCNDNFTELYNAAVYSNISNGTSNVKVVSSGGNVTVGVGGTGNVAVFATTGEYITGLISATGNIRGGNLSAVNLVINSISSDDSSFVSIEDGVNITGAISATGNITGGNLSAVNLVINRISSDDSSFVSIEDGVNVTGAISATGNITGGNVLGGANVNATTHTGTTVSVTGNITGGNVLGGANVNATTHTGTTVSVTGNITGGNVLFGAGVVSGTGNITGGPYLKTSSLTVATLPVAATAGAGARSFVSDATATTFASIVAGSGANPVPVFSDGTNWKIG